MIHSLYKRKKGEYMMDDLINSKLLTDLIKECDNIRRREASDIEDDDFDKKSIPYIDTNNYVDKVNSDNNTLIFGRRGCGKTSLLIKVAQENSKNKDNKLIIVKDMQSMKKTDKDIIVIKLLLKTISEMEKYLNSEITPLIMEAYKNDYKGIKGIWKRIIKKQNEDIRKKYNELREFAYLVEKMKTNLSRISGLEKSLKYKIVTNHEERKERNQNFACKFDGKVLTKENLEFDLLRGIGKLENDFELGIELSNIVKNDASIVDTKAIKREDEITKYRADILEEQKDNIVALFKCFYSISKKKIVLMLDDFYQIKNDNQPFIIQFLHDISKECTNKGFKFKVFVIPGRVALNEEGVDMSYKDDFSPVTIDTDISNIEFLRGHLSNMLSEISKSIDEEHYLSQQDILELFVRHNNDEVFTYMILASGAVPRDFIVLFKEVIIEARKNHQDCVKKENVYDVVKKTRDDKDNNVENDASLSSETIDILRRSLENDFASQYKTNVFLYPLSEANDKVHEIILRNLENLRYIYLIKDNLTSEKTKEQCKAYMIDMSFCIVGSRKKNNFEIRKYWEKTEKSSVLRQSVIWSFPSEVIEIVEEEIKKTKNSICT